MQFWNLIIMIMIMIDNKYLFMYCCVVFMYTMIVIQYARCDDGDGPTSRTINTIWDYNITLKQTQIKDVSCGKEQMCSSSKLRQCPHSRRMWSQHVPVGECVLLQELCPACKHGPHTRTQHIVSDINRNVQNARLGVISAGSGETHIVQTLPWSRSH